MSFRTVLVIVLPIVCGVTAAIGVSAVVKGSPAVTQQPQETVPVVVAVAELGRFTNLTPDHVKIKDLPKELVPDGAINKAEDAYGRSVVVPMVKGEPILLRKVSEKGYHGIEPAIPKGMRAVTVLTANAAAGVAGFVLPGSKVDVTLTTSSATDPTSAKSWVLLEDIEVLASQQYVAAPGEKVSVGELHNVTLLVTQEQAMKVAFAQTRGGTIQLLLRTPDDKELVPQRVFEIADLYPRGTKTQPTVAEVVEKLKAPETKRVVYEEAGELTIMRGMSTSIIRTLPREVKQPVQKESTPTQTESTPAQMEPAPDQTGATLD